MPEHSDLLGQLAAIGVVLLLLTATILLLQRRGGFPGWRQLAGGGPENSELRVRGRLSLTAQHTLHLIALGQGEMLVITHPAGATVVSPGEPFSSAMTRSLRGQIGAAQ